LACFKECGYLIDETVKTLRMMAVLGKDGAELLIPAVMAMSMEDDEEYDGDSYQ
jgi:hypothetical protein